MNMRTDEGAVDPQEPKWRYDVFLTFRGEDTRYGFAGNLCNALRLKRIKTFMDDGGLKIGDQIAASFLEALEESRISIVILSDNYGFSSWCLDELAKIMECRKTKGQLVLPIFYQVYPFYVRHQRGSYEEAMAFHESRLGKDSGKVEIWRTALSEIGSLSGLYFGRDFGGYEYEFIQKIVDSVIQSLPRYDVFLSFSGEDTRYSFTGFLYNALSREGFKAFMDDEGLVSGNEISQALISAIEKSRLSIVVFSENYGYSPWCLDELVKIIECMKTKNRLIWPIFYKVEQSDVSYQKKSYGDAMAAHEELFGKVSEKVQKWRSALSEVAKMKGEHLKENEYEYELIQRIVELADHSLSFYDVFLSFSREDTSHFFSRHLYDVLCKKGFKTFMDDKGIEDGIQVKQRAIENSRHFVIVFSKNYAYSSWCLAELVKILECKKRKMKDHVVWPIFYEVEPSHVREQGHSYGHAIAAHEKVFGKDSDKVRKWKSALSEIPYLGGYYGKSESQSEDIYNKTEHENELIKQVVEQLSFPYSGKLDPKGTPSTGGFTIGLHRQQG